MIKEAEHAFLDDNYDLAIKKYQQARTCRDAPSEVYDFTKLRINEIKRLKNISISDEMTYSALSRKMAKIEKLLVTDDYNLDSIRILIDNINWMNRDFEAPGLYLHGDIFRRSMIAAWTLEEDTFLRSLEPLSVLKIPKGYSEFYPEDESKMFSRLQKSGKLYQNDVCDTLEKCCLASIKTEGIIIRGIPGGFIIFTIFPMHENGARMENPNYEGEIPVPNDKIIFEKIFDFFTAGPEGLYGMVVVVASRDKFRLVGNEIKLDSKETITDELISSTNERVIDYNSEASKMLFLSYSIRVTRRNDSNYKFNYEVVLSPRASDIYNKNRLSDHIQIHHAK